MDAQNERMASAFRLFARMTATIVLPQVNFQPDRSKNLIYVSFYMRTAESPARAFDSLSRTWFPGLLRTRRVGTESAQDGCLTVDAHQRTRVDGLYAAGDMSCSGCTKSVMQWRSVSAITIRGDLAKKTPLRR
jgi:hypothetical protein